LLLVVLFWIVVRLVRIALHTRRGVHDQHDVRRLRLEKQQRIELRGRGPRRCMERDDQQRDHALAQEGMTHEANH
jgi:hypothetical protein